MRYENARFISALPFEIAENSAFGIEVERARYVVENEDLRVLKERTRNGNALLLPA